MKNLPPLEAGADADVASLAYQLALQITAPMIFGEVGYIKNFTLVNSWEKEVHTPTVERPSGLLDQLVAVMQ
jgi:hypothetical protein